MGERLHKRKPKLYGAAYSVYVRCIRLVLYEKGVDYEHIPIDIFHKDGPPTYYRELHPFSRIPAFEDGDFSLYESGAISRYIDESFAGPKLQPTDLRDRARCNQIMSILDNYVYPHGVWGIYVERVNKPKEGEAPDEAKVAKAVEVSQTCLQAVQDILGNNTWLAGSEVTLADLHAAPMFAYFVETEEGRHLLKQYSGMAAWWSRMCQRPSVLATEPS